MNYYEVNKLHIQLHIIANSLPTELVICICHSKVPSYRLLVATIKYPPAKFHLKQGQAYTSGVYVMARVGTRTANSPAKLTRIFSISWFLLVAALWQIVPWFIGNTSGLHQCFFNLSFHLFPPIFEIES